MSLAEEFLADFDSDEEDDIEDIVDNQIVNSNNNEIDKDEMKIEETNNNNFNVFKVPNMPHKQKTEEISKLKYERLEDVSTLLFDETLSSLLANINSRKEELLTNDSSSLNNNNHNNKIEGEEKEEDISDYNLIVKCNATILKIGEDITKVHKFIRDFFAKKFPELESLVLNAVEYAKVVKLIGNSTNLSQIEFSDILPPPTIMVVKMAGSASVQLKEILSPFILENINKACDGLIKLDEIKNSILEFVESRMATIAPNLTAIVGSAISARLIGIAGGLLPLSRLPACNVQILGSSKKTLEGFSTASTVKHVGFINDCDIISTTPPSLRKKAVRVIAAKCVLAARIDSYKDSPTGDKGLEMRKEIEKKIEKWQEPPPAKQPKPLPAPDDKIKKNRGGKRKRRMKERYAVSDLRKFANRMSFGVSDDEIGPAGSIIEDEKGLGGNSYNTGYVGHRPIKLHLLTDKKLSKRQAMIQEQQQKRKALRSASGAATQLNSSGLSSTIAFTPVQGMEFVDPNLAIARTEVIEKKKYFSTVGSFGSHSKS